MRKIAQKSIEINSFENLVKIISQCLFMPLEFVSEKQLLAKEANHLIALKLELHTISKSVAKLRAGIFARFYERFSNSIKKRIKRVLGIK